MDPIAFFPLEVCELIVQHLNLTSAIEVSLLWKKTVLDSFRQIKKMKIGIYHYILSDATQLESIINRIYEETKKIVYADECMKNLSVGKFKHCDFINLPTDLGLIKKLYQIVLGLPQLKSLKIDMRDWEKYSDFDLPVNFSIESLHLTCNDLEEQKNFIEKTPNVKHLKIVSMDQETMEYLSANLRNLRSLHVKRICGLELSSPNLFPNLENLNVSFILSSNQDELALVKNPSNFVKMILSLNEPECYILD